MEDSETSVQRLAFVGLGSNQGDRKHMLAKAVTALEDVGFELVICSSIYETAPWGMLDQPNFLNMVVAGRWNGSPLGLLQACLGIERELGRVRQLRYGPRTIDLDVLAFGNEQLDLPELQIPHPRITERAFVLIPLAEIAGDYVLPGQTLSVDDWVETLTEDQKRQVGLWIEIDEN